MRLPSKATLDYWKTAGEVVLLAVLVPCIVIALLRDPRRAVEHARVS